MERMSLDHLDRQLGDWLREERATRAPEHLVEDVFSRTARERQVWRWPVALTAVFTERHGIRFAPALAAAVILLIAIGLVGPFGVGPGPGQRPTPTPTTEPTTTPAPSESPQPPTPTPEPTPASTSVGEQSARSLFLGTDAAPIGVVEAFGSVWVANIHANDVRRYDPDTMAEQARIDVPSAAWFGVTEDALWVTHQNDTGLSRIDPATNTVVTDVGDVPPCAEPVIAFESVWQSACDAGVILRIDPDTNEIQDTIPSQGYRWLTFAGGRLIALGSNGLAALDPDTREFTPMPNPDIAGADFLTSGGESLWAQTATNLFRIDPATGQTQAALDIPGVRAVDVSADSVWITTTGQGIVELDLATNEIVRTIPMSGSALLAFVSGDTLWVTDFNESMLWRIQL